MCDWRIGKQIIVRQFATYYPEFEIMPQAVTQLSWGHISVLIHKGLKMTPFVVGTLNKPSYRHDIRVFIKKVLKHYQSIIQQRLL